MEHIKELVVNENQLYFRAEAIFSIVDLMVVTLPMYTFHGDNHQYVSIDDAIKFYQTSKSIKGPEILGYLMIIKAKFERGGFIVRGEEAPLKPKS